MSLVMFLPAFVVCLICLLVGLWMNFHDIFEKVMLGVQKYSIRNVRRFRLHRLYNMTFSAFNGIVKHVRSRIAMENIAIVF